MKPVARKRFGQHFLVDRGVIESIVAVVAPKPGENLIEIGPGDAALTAVLLDRVPRLRAIEIDRDLAARLRKRFGDRLDLLEADVLTVDFAQFACDGPLRLVGNLPYNISTPLLVRLIDYRDQVLDQHFMLQKEVAQRMAAAPGGKDYGRLTVMLQWRYRIDTVLEVAPQAFDPPPQVDSAVVRMQPLTLPVPQAPALLGELVATAFSQRRKLLRHTLGRWLDARGFAGRFDLQRRAEEVPVAQYVALAEQLHDGTHAPQHPEPSVEP